MSWSPSFQFRSSLLHFVHNSLLLIPIGSLLGSNDPNTIPDLTGFNVLVLMECSMFLLGLHSALDLATFMFPPDSVISGYISCDFLDICFMFYLSLLPYVSLACTMFHPFTFSDSTVTLNPILLSSLSLLRSCTCIPLQRIHSLVYISHVLVTIDLRTNITCSLLISL